MDVIRDCAGLPARAVVDRLVAALDLHRAGHPPNDDTTIVAVRITEG